MDPKKPKPSAHPIVLEPDESFTCKEWHLPSLDARTDTRYFFDYLLLLQLKGRGMRFIGDNVEHFKEYDFLLIGPNLLCSSLCDAQPAETHHITSSFNENFLGEKFLAVPETAAIRNLLMLARRGVAFPTSAARQLAPDMIRMAQTKGGERLCLLLSILNRLASVQGIRQLASDGFARTWDDEETTRFVAVCKYIQHSYAGKINRETAAKIAGLSVSAFSRYFHRVMGRTFKTYVTEVRVGHACRKLLQQDTTISHIAFETGFNNLANFNNIFRQIKGMTPREFRRLNAHTTAAPE